MYFLEKQKVRLCQLSIFMAAGRCMFALKMDMLNYDVLLQCDALYHIVCLQQGKLNNSK